MFTGNIGWGEIIVLFIVVLLLFGPKRLPEVSRQIGKALGILRKTYEDFKREIDNIEIEEITKTSVDKEEQSSEGKEKNDHTSHRTLAG